MKKLFLSLVFLSSNVNANEILVFPVDEVTSVQIKYNSMNETYEVIHPSKTSATLSIKKDFGISQKMCAHRLEQVLQAKGDEAALNKAKNLARSASTFEITGKIMPSYPKSQDLISFLKQHAISKGKNFSEEKYLSKLDTITAEAKITLSANSLYGMLGEENHIEKIKEQIRYKTDANGVFKIRTNASDLLCDLISKRAKFEINLNVSRVQGLPSSVLTIEDVRRLSASVERQYSQNISFIEGWFSGDKKDVILTSLLVSREFNKVFGRDLTSIGNSNAVELVSSMIGENGKPYTLDVSEASRVSEKIKINKSNYSNSKTNVTFERFETYE